MSVTDEQTDRITTACTSAVQQHRQGRSRGWPSWPKPPTIASKKKLLDKKKLILFTAKFLKRANYSNNMLCQTFAGDLIKSCLLSFIVVTTCIGELQMNIYLQHSHCTLYCILVGRCFECLMMLQVHRSDAVIDRFATTAARRLNF